MTDRDIIYDEVEEERERQDEAWGEQNHPSVGSVMEAEDCPAEWAAKMYELPTARRAQYLCDRAADKDQMTWAHIAVEEMAESIEAAAEGRMDDCKTELIQTVAVCVAWIESIERTKENTE